MTKDHHPLDEAFDMVQTIDELEAEIIIPDDPTLDTIRDFALRTYKDQMDTLGLIEPKNRARYLEIAERFLGQAKDAIYKKEYIQLRREYLMRGQKIPTKEQLEGKTQDDSGDQNPVESKSREEMFALINGGKK